MGNFYTSPITKIDDNIDVSSLLMMFHADTLEDACDIAMEESSQIFDEVRKIKTELNASNVFYSLLQGVYIRDGRRYGVDLCVHESVSTREWKEFENDERWRQLNDASMA